MTEADTDSHSALTPVERKLAAASGPSELEMLRAEVARLSKQMKDSGIAPSRNDTPDRLHTAEECAKRIFKRMTDTVNPVRSDGLCSGAGMADPEMLRLFSWLRVTKVDLGLDEAENLRVLSLSAEAGQAKPVFLRNHAYNIYCWLMPYYKVDRASRDSKGRRRYTEEGEAIIDRQRPAFQIIGNEGAVGVDLQNDWPADGTNEAFIELAWRPLLFPHLTFWPHRPPTMGKDGPIQYTADGLRQWKRTRLDEKTMGSSRRSDSLKIIKQYWNKAATDAKGAEEHDWAKEILNKVGTDGSSL